MTVLVVGAPRSGTSWVARVLAATPGAVYLNEPDNHEHVPFALRAKLGSRGRFYPLLDEHDEAPAYERLWRAALGGDARPPLAPLRRRVAQHLLRGRSSAVLLDAISHPEKAGPVLRAAAALATPERPPPGAPLVVKSVHAQLSLEWIARRFPVEVVVVLRDPLNVLSSWKALGWIAPAGVLRELGPEAVEALGRRLGAPDTGARGPLEEAALLIGLLTAALKEAARRNPGWQVERHEELCTSPHERFPALAAGAGLDWDARAERLLDDLDRPGSGYETTRVAETLPEAWRSRLDREELRAAARILDRLPLDRTPAR